MFSLNSLFNEFSSMRLFLMPTLTFIWGYHFLLCSLLGSSFLKQQSSNRQTWMLQNLKRLFQMDFFCLSGTNEPLLTKNSKSYFALFCIRVIWTSSQLVLNMQWYNFVRGQFFQILSKFQFSISIYLTQLNFTCFTKG